MAESDPKSGSNPPDATATPSANTPKQAEKAAPTVKIWSGNWAVENAQTNNVPESTQDELEVIHTAQVDLRKHGTHYSPLPPTSASDVPLEENDPGLRVEQNFDVPLESDFAAPPNDPSKKPDTL